MQQKRVNAVVISQAHEVSYQPHDMTWEETQALVKVERGGICGSDIHYFLHGRAGMSILKAPMVLGHELIGRVEYAPAGSGLAAGQPVAVNPSFPCRRCSLCHEGKANLCRAMRFMGSAQFFPHVNGGFAEYVAVQPEQCIPYDPQADPRAIAFAEPLAVCIHAVRQAGDLVGKKVLVTGAGPIGCLVIAAARAAGAAHITATDLSERCRSLALEMGADAAVDPRDEALTAGWASDGGVYDVSMEASGAPAAIASMVAYTRPGGTIIQLGMGVPEIAYPVGSLLVKELVLKGSFRFNGEFETAVRWLESKRIDPLPLLSAEMPMREAAPALALAADKGRAAKVQLTF
ncbi:L-idonate 5-dehydrogenase [Chimaeribacter californicus]|uniref:L-idonate 5-dehydrogenase n=1 Tax=Chimaeribacter californicus TaxID=2060067 RepID=A0A2N5DZU1_9GAMM|nr:L-idonate 5-dehydrogenase [Chimaeribacter californicus]PLR33358.1 L-idonate 5-dehydrogenase [Chimaeribacter californicus]